MITKMTTSKEDIRQQLQARCFASVEKMTKERHNPRRSANRLSTLQSGADAPRLANGSLLVSVVASRPQQARSDLSP
jgi:hypothetical protein